LGGRGTPSRTVIREGTAAPGSGMPGAARTSPSEPEGSDGEREQPGGMATPVAGLPPAQDPAGGARSDAAPLAGQEFRDAWKRARSGRAADLRRGRSGPRQQPGYQPGGNRRGGAS
jgi:hypothetical protein